MVLFGDNDACTWSSAPDRGFQGSYFGLWGRSSGRLENKHSRKHTAKRPRSSFGLPFLASYVKPCGTSAAVSTVLAEHLFPFPPSSRPNMRFLRSVGCDMIHGGRIKIDCSAVVIAKKNSQSSITMICNRPSRRLAMDDLQFTILVPVEYGVLESIVLHRREIAGSSFRADVTLPPCSWSGTESFTRAEKTRPAEWIDGL